MSLPPVSGITPAGLPISMPVDTTATSSVPPLTATASPAAQVNLNPPATTREAPPVYTLGSTKVDYLRHQYDTGAGYVISQQLLIEQATRHANNTPFKASPFFSQLGGLSAETASFRNEVRSFRVPADIAADQYSPSFTGLAGKRQESVTLTIRTREGDTVNIQLVRRQGTDNESMAFSFEVTGELSKEERAALDKLASKLGEVADEFFRTGTAELRGLAELDDAAITSFSLSLAKPRGDDYDTLTYDFRIDETTNTRHLSGKDAQGYEFDINAHIKSLLATDKLSAHQTLEQYLMLIREAGNTRGAASASVRFMVDGLRSVLALDDMDLTAKEPSSMPSAFLTGLPDFTASFRSAITFNPENRTQVSAMELTMGQDTRVETEGPRLLIQQQSYYDLHSSYFRHPHWLEAADFTGGNYVYAQEHRSGKTTRTLDMTNNQVNHALIEREQSRHVKEAVYQNFQQIDGRNHTFEDRQIHDLVDQLSDRITKDDQRHSLMGLLRAERQSLFRLA